MIVSIPTSIFLLHKDILSQFEFVLQKQNWWASVQTCCLICVLQSLGFASGPVKGDKGKVFIMYLQGSECDSGPDYSSKIDFECDPKSGQVSLNCCDARRKEDLSWRIKLNDVKEVIVFQF